MMPTSKHNAIFRLLVTEREIRNVSAAFRYAERAHGKFIFPGKFFETPHGVRQRERKIDFVFVLAERVSKLAGGEAHFFGAESIRNAVCRNRRAERRNFVLREGERERSAARAANAEVKIKPIALRIAKIGRELRFRFFKL